MSDNQYTERAETTVDDVRRVRQGLDRIAGGDIGKLIEQANNTLEEWRQRLGLKVVQPPPRSNRSSATGS